MLGVNFLAIIVGFLLDFTVDRNFSSSLEDRGPLEMGRPAVGRQSSFCVSSHVTESESVPVSVIGVETEGVGVFRAWEVVGVSGTEVVWDSIDIGE